MHATIHAQMLAGYMSGEVQARKVFNNLSSSRLLGKPLNSADCRYWTGSSPDLLWVKLSSNEPRRETETERLGQWQTRGKRPMDTERTRNRGRRAGGGNSGGGLRSHPFPPQSQLL
eukprot:755466-Hanusia_phi.AAC.1